jgi:hypothetical protein
MWELKRGAVSEGIVGTELGNFFTVLSYSFWGMSMLCMFPGALHLGPYSPGPLSTTLLPVSRGRALPSLRDKEIIMFCPVGTESQKCVVLSTMTFHTMEKSEFC